MSKSKIPSLANLPVLGPTDTIGEGDSFVKYNLLQDADVDGGSELEHQCFSKLIDEVAWQTMLHASGEVPRLVAVQGHIGEDGSKPVYRHPADQSPPLLPFTPTVVIIKAAAEKLIGHQLNHALIQMYRNGNDYISEHSDKTLDIVPGSKIVNASFGAQRTMRLRRKRKLEIDKANSSPGTRSVEQRQTQRVAMPHDSLFVLGLVTNRSWLHGINADKRLKTEKSARELAFEGRRISLTFRYIGTFLSADERLIWGQGARGKSKQQANAVIVGQADQIAQLIEAFGAENHQDETFDWHNWYGQGFDVLHFRA